MAEIDNQIALKVQTPNPLNTMSEVANMGNRLIQLKKSQATLPYDIAKSKAESETAQVGATHAQWKLNTDQAQKAFEIAGGLVQDPAIVNGDSEGSVTSLMQAEDRMRAFGIPESKIRVQMAPLYSVATHNPKALRQVLQNVIAGNMTAPSQANAIQPNYVTSANDQGVSSLQQTNPLAGGSPQSLPLGLPPTTPTVHPVTNQPGYVGGKGFVPSAPPLGVAQNIADLQKEVGEIRKAGDQIPIQRNVNQNILRLSKDTKTGPGTQYWQNALSGTLAPLGVAPDNYQELGKFLEKQALQNMQAMGGQPSDARLSAAAAANGSTQFNPGALQMVTKFNDASASALDKYRQGVDKAVGSNDFGALAKFKSEWTKNLDIDVFRVENAIRDKDSSELQRIAKELGPERMKQLATKRKNLERLSQDGR
jgi:hypothetical protein